MSQQQRGRQEPPQNQRPADGQRRFARPPVREVGPTAEQLQPPKRRQKDLLYAEDTIEALGAERTQRPFALEICDVIGDTFVAEEENGRSRESSKRIFILFKDPRTGRPWLSDLPDPKRRGEFLPKWYVCNATAKKALAAAFGTRRVVNWVGWVGVAIREVENRLKKAEGGGYEQVIAIRFSNKLPDLEPSFDYAAEVQRRIARLGGAAPSSSTQTADDPDDDIPPEDEQSAIEAAEREEDDDDEGR